MSDSELSRVLALIAQAPFDVSAGEAALRAGIESMGDAFPVPEGVTVEASSLGGVPTEKLTFDAAGPVLLYLHGGGYVIGSPRSHRHLAGLLAREIGGTVYTADYRMAPEAPFPAAVEDAVAAYRALLETAPASRIAVAGDSAGGGLTFALALALRDAGLSLPACLVGLSPWVELGTANESYDKLAGVDPLLSRKVCDYFSSRYLAGESASHPLASPLRANLAGLPPVMVQVGDREVFFGDAASMHQSLIAAGVEARFTVRNGMFHVWHLYWPMLEEGRRAVGEIARFVVERTRIDER